MLHSGSIQSREFCSLDLLRISGSLSVSEDRVAHSLRSSWHSTELKECEQVADSGEGDKLRMKRASAVLPWGNKFMLRGLTASGPSQS